ncbi:hypothetical protein BDZ97DRAFT_1617138, partial [Flammula alnicola]
MSSFSKFKLDIPRQTPGDCTLDNASSTLFWDLAQPESSPKSAAGGIQKLYGDYQYDSESGRYDMSWRSWEEFLSFLAQEQASNSIELRRVSSTTGAERYLERTVYVCARYGTGGKKNYEKK